MPLFPVDHKTSTTFRYQPLDWDGQALDSPAEPILDPTRAESLQLRSAQQGTVVDPRHVRLQNRLYKSLCSEHGTRAVEYEVGCVDLKVKVNGECTFYEIKSSLPPKKAFERQLVSCWSILAIQLEAALSSLSLSAIHLQPWKIENIFERYEGSIASLFTTESSIGRVARSKRSYSSAFR
jgi:hypothetical protein